jgi:hypothetical protein
MNFISQKYLLCRHSLIPSRTIRHGPHKKEASNSMSVVARVFFAAVTFLTSRCLVTVKDTHFSTQTDGRDLLSTSFRRNQVL